MKKEPKAATNDKQTSLKRIFKKKLICKDQSSITISNYYKPLCENKVIIERKQKIVQFKINAEIKKY